MSPPNPPSAPPGHRTGSVPLSRMREPPALEFDLLAEIATGPTARVELCQIKAPAELEGQFCAVKRLYPHIAEDPQFLSMFTDEIWMTALLAHPNVVNVLGWGNDAHGMYLAVELVQGVSLARLMKTVFETREAFTERMVVSVGAQLCAGLSSAHALRSPEGEHLGLVHRDLTPGNVLLGFDGQVKIADFGLAKAKQRLTKTLTGMLKGHPHYMAPEQADEGGIDHRADLFSLGVVLFEMFTGRHPWSGANELEVLHAMCNKPPLDIAELRPRLDRELAKVVGGLLERDPRRRFENADVVGARLLSWLDTHGYADGDDGIARFVRRNSMRQMRWFERAAQGELKVEAERARVRLSGVKRARTQTRDGRGSNRRRTRSRADETTEVSSLKTPNSLSLPVPPPTSSSEFSEEVPTVVQAKRTVGHLSAPLLDEDSDQRRTAVKPAVPGSVRLPPPRMQRRDMQAYDTDSAPTRPKSTGLPGAFSLPGAAAGRGLHSSQDTFQDFPTLDDPESEELPTHPLRSIPHEALRAIAERPLRTLGGQPETAAPLTERLTAAARRARSEAEQSAKLAAQRSVIAQLCDDALAMAREAERLESFDPGAAASLWVEARRLSETAQKGEGSLAQSSALQSAQTPLPLSLPPSSFPPHLPPPEAAVSALTPPHFPSAPPPPPFGLPQPGEDPHARQSAAPPSMGPPSMMGQPDLRLPAITPHASAPPPPLTLGDELKLLLAGEVFGLPVPVALGIAFGTALLFVVITALLVG